MMLRATLAAAIAATAFGQSWKIISDNVGQTLTSVAMFGNGQNGVITVSDGFGYVIKTTSDGGKTWPTEAPNQGGYLFVLNNAAAYGTAAVVTGQFANQFSLNSGAFFNSSLGGGGCDNIRTMAGNTGFACMGEVGNANGVATSTTGGLSFTAVDAGFTNNTLANFGAFPSATTWYLTGALAPALEDLPAGVRAVRRINPNLHFETKENGKTEAVFGPRKLQKISQQAQIRKTADGGKTWSLVYSALRVFAQGIDCADNAGQNCCTALMSQSGPLAGAYVACTSNGGQTWTTTHNDTTAGASLNDLRAVSATEYWMVGGSITQTALQAIFWHSTDGGNTWTADTTLNNYYATGINCLPTGGCWASLVDGNSNSYVAQLQTSSKPNLRATAN